ncbi:NAD-binding protein [Rhodoplanes serenus]|uniref:2-hydroxy-3-oxopropionate reductase n=1 Tax=Rhodoplanes serenus TaxID=200615 RepID=A0A447CS39_9BRAD|nr:NAD(P)-dependent oxidoreductase [Rhodoplanes serenus]MBI5113316.1 NAD(P)-dependent oxidoreductase [Rhodovulum sp.]MTW16695.1 NAD-binding protein [Rhodoplanes serenus]VCU08028.1 2-hydroxy-3-oxopropionate reductase [Rhodoplanes serenus]
MAARAKGAVGIVGLGIMGGAFAKNLVASGWRVTGYDIDPARRRALARAGVTIAPDIAAAAAAAPVLLTSLPSPQALRDVVAAIVDAKLPPRIIAETSTFTLEDKLAAEKALRKAGHTVLDTPMSGTGAQAAVKDLVVLASGDSKAIAKLKPMFLGFARLVHDLGVFGNGSRMKYIANLLVAIHNVASAEAMVLGMKAGLDPQMVFEVIKSGAGTSRMFEARAPMMVADKYDPPTMKIKVWQKDMDVIGAFADSLGVPTPLFNATMPIYAAARSLGLGMLDTGAVCTVLEGLAGVKRTGRPRKRKSA